MKAISYNKIDPFDKEDFEIAVFEQESIAGTVLYLITGIALLCIFAGNMCMSVHAAELELEPRTTSDNNPYKFKISYTWTSEGETIQSYDISESGQIAIVFSNRTVGVFDQDMNFQYQISFEISGSYGAAWIGEKLLFISLRSSTAVLCDKNGSPEKYYNITGPAGYDRKIVDTRLRTWGDYQYFCTNESGGDDPLVHYGYYTILKRKSPEGKEEILYKADALFDGVRWVMVVICGYFALCLSVGYIFYLSYRKRYNSRDPEKKRFGHRPCMKYITKLSCGQVLARLWTESSSLIDCKFEKDDADSYLFTINDMVNCHGKARYKVVIVPEQEWSAVYFMLIDYKASQYALDAFAWELKRVLEKKLEAVRME